MATVEAHHHAAQGLQVPFVVKLGGMHTNHDEAVAEPFFQPSKLLRHVDAVDAPVGPEIQDDDLALDIRRGQSPRHVQPLEILRQAQRRPGGYTRIRSSPLTGSQGGQDQNETCQTAQERR